jgi:probable rRNA maturation factor
MIWVDVADPVAREMEPLVEGLELDAQRALDVVGRGTGELSLAFMDDGGIAPLNLRWRGKSGPTDVLSFPQDTPANMPIDLLGDIVISVDTARAQAKERGHSLATELRVLLVHGLCHLLGHDHYDPVEAEAMAVVERRVLARLSDGRGPQGLVDVAMRGNRSGRGG